HRRASCRARTRRAAAGAACRSARRHRDRTGNLARAQARSTRGRPKGAAGRAGPGGLEPDGQAQVSAVAEITSTAAATARPTTARPPPVLFLADHLGLPSGCVHGVTTYLLDVLPSLKAGGVEVAACFLKAAHPAARSLREHGIPVHFLETRRFNPFVVRRVGEIVRGGGYRVLHCTQYRASIVGRALARGNRALRTVLHVHDLNVPPSPVRMLNRALADK